MPSRAPNSHRRSGARRDRFCRLHGPNGSQLLRAEDAVDIENHDELIFPLAHAANEIRMNLSPDLRGWLDLLRLEVNHFLDGIRESSDHGGVTFEYHFDHDDAGVPRAFGFRHLEAKRSE